MTRPRPGRPSLDFVRTIAELRAITRGWRHAASSIGLVPTMGGLHDGHIALVRRALSQCDRVIVSIFVNPRQFGSADDLARYPRREDEDRGKPAAAGAHLAFMPPVSEIYPGGFATAVSVAGPLTQVLDAVHRPGHFEGVATVVAKLLLQAMPDIAFFGEKDFQQLQVVRRMVRDLDIPARIEPVPTVRDADGLALSSRNFNLSPDERQIAAAFPAVLFGAAGSHSPRRRCRRSTHGGAGRPDPRRFWTGRLRRLGRCRDARPGPRGRFGSCPAVRCRMGRPHPADRQYRRTADSQSVKAPILREGSDMPDIPRLNPAIRALESGKPAFVTFSPAEIGAAQSIGAAAYDGVVFEMEHNPYDIRQLRDCMQYMLDRAQILKSGSLAPAVAPFVRIPPNGGEMNQFIAKQVLDIGVYGIVWPHVSTVEEARNAVQACRYPRPREAAILRAGRPARRRAAHRRALLGHRPADLLQARRHLAAQPRGRGAGRHHVRGEARDPQPAADAEGGAGDRRRADRRGRPVAGHGLSAPVRASRGRRGDRRDRWRSARTPACRAATRMSTRTMSRS